MTSDKKEKLGKSEWQTASTIPVSNDAGISSQVVKGNARPGPPPHPPGGNFQGLAAPGSGLLTPEEIIIDVDADGDGMAFRFTWR